VDAGKPNLLSITQNWTSETQAKLDMELRSFKDRKLLENKLLLSKKTDTKEGD
jgi:hypothetical protein